jgi:hypothetical protein
VKKEAWRCGSSDRVPVLQVPSPDVKPNINSIIIKKKKKKKISEERELGILPSNTQTFIKCLFFSPSLSLTLCSANLPE